VYQLAKTTNNLTALNRNLKLHQNFKELYFKFIQASSKVFSPFNDLDFNIITTKKINSPNKKVLYIDDEADKGWEEVLKSIFVGAEFESVGKMENESAETYYAKAKTKALEIEIEKNLPKWDLILLDLRLDETEDVGENAFKLASSYSGAKLLKEIKTGNKGNQGIQVIIFTASNKAWNMRELLIDLKADGFFVKESPEYNSDVIFSEKNYENFENQVIYCYNRSYLRSIFKILNPLKDVCQNELNAKPGRGKLSFPNTLVNDIGQSLNVFEELLIGHSSELNYAFGTLILTIESIVNEMYYDSVDDQLVSIGLLEQKCNFLKGDDRFLSITPVNDGKEYKKGEFRLILDEEISKYNKKVKFIPFNFRLACILHFKYGLKLDQSLFRFFKIYKLRSEHVFHKGSEKIDSSDLLLMLELLTIFLSK
jgi:CheY-like chemotaxis protein